MFHVQKYKGSCFYSVAKSCLTLCDPMDCSMSGFTVLHYLPESAQTHVLWVSDVIKLSHSLSPSSPDFSLSQSFPMSWLFALGDQSIGASASALILLMNIQICFALGLTGLISLQSKGLSKPYSKTEKKKKKLTKLFFFFSIFWLQGMWNLSSTTKDWTLSRALKAWHLNHWTAREIPKLFLFSSGDC